MCTTCGCSDNAHAVVTDMENGKTTLLDRTVRDLAGEMPIHVIDGDQEIMRDAARIRATGCRVVQISTSTGEGMNTWYQWLKDAVQTGTVSVG